MGILKWIFESIIWTKLLQSIIEWASDNIVQYYSPLLVNNIFDVEMGITSIYCKDHINAIIRSGPSQTLEILTDLFNNVNKRSKKSRRSRHTHS